MFFQTNMHHSITKVLEMEFIKMYLLLKKILKIWEGSMLTIMCVSIMYGGGNKSCVVHQLSAPVLY